MLGCCAGAPLSAPDVLNPVTLSPCDGTLSSEALTADGCGRRIQSRANQRILGRDDSGPRRASRAPIPHGPCESQFATQHGSWGRRHRRPRSLALGSGEVGAALSPPAAARGNSGCAGVTAYSRSDLFERRRVLDGRLGLAEVAVLGIPERRDHPVVDGEQVKLRQARQESRVGAAAAADGAGVGFRGPRWYGLHGQVPDFMPLRLHEEGACHTAHARPSDPLQTAGQVVSARRPGARSRREAGWR